MEEKAKFDNVVMRIIKVSELGHILAHTNRGDLCMVLPYNKTKFDYKFTLDAVPLSDKENKALYEIYEKIFGEQVIKNK